MSYQVSVRSNSVSKYKVRRAAGLRVLLGGEMFT